MVPVIRRSAWISGRGTLGKGTWHPLSPAAPAEVTYLRLTLLVRLQVGCARPRTRGKAASHNEIQLRRSVVQARRVLHPWTLSFVSSRFVWPACRLSDLTRRSERDFARSATMYTHPNAHFWIKKQRRHGELGSSRCLSCKRSNWNWPPFPCDGGDGVILVFFSLPPLLPPISLRGYCIEASARA